MRTISQNGKNKFILMLNCRINVTMDEVEEGSFMLMPINVGHECQMLMHNNDQLKICQLEAFNYWIRSWNENINTQSSSERGNYEVKLPIKYNCCYRWSLLDCLTESVQDFCPDADTFDLRQVSDS